MNKVKILLLLCNLIVGFIIYLNVSEDKNNPRDFALKLVDILDGLDEVKVSQGKDQHILIQKDKDDWSIQNPIEWSAESLVISNLKTRLAHSNPQLVITQEDLLKRGEVLADYGIDSNSTRIRIQGNGKRTTIVLGNETRDSQGMFIQIEEYESFRKAIWKASKDLMSLASTSPAFWGKTTFFNTPMYGIDQVSITINDKNQSSKKMTSLQKRNQSWYFTEPESKIADPKEINLVINELLSFRVAEFVLDENLTSMPEGEPDISVKIAGMGSNELLHIFENDVRKELICFHPKNNAFFKIKHEFKEKVSDWYKKYRENKIFLLPKQNIEAITINSDSGKLSFGKEQGNLWQVKEKNQTIAENYLGETEEIHNFIDLLYSARISDFVGNDDNLNLTNKGGASVLTSYIGGDSIKLEILDSTSGSSYSVVRINDAEQSVVVNLDKDEILCRKKNSFRNKSLQIENFNHFSFYSVENNSTFINIEDNVTVNTLSESLTVDRFLPSAIESLGLWYQGDWNPWTHTLKFKDESNESVGTLYISANQISGEWFGGLEKDGTTFTLSEQFIDWAEKLISTP